MDEVARGVTWPPMLALLLATCGTSEATSIHAQAKEEPVQIRAAARVDRDSPVCGSIDGMELVVFEGNREISSELYCSAYNRGQASTVTDARGEHYVLLRYSEGRGTRATTDHLRIFRLSDDDLDLRADLEVRRAIGVAADQVYNYRVETPADGGLVLTGLWTVEGPLFSRDPQMPARRRTVIAIDTASERPSG